MKIAILHYSVPPIVGGVEAVIGAHASLQCRQGYTVRLIAGAGDQNALPPGVEFTRLPEMDSQHPAIIQASRELEAGRLPADFEPLVTSLRNQLEPLLQGMDAVMVHNIFTKHFNLPLTAALSQLLDQGRISNCIAWCHDFSWTSLHSRSRLHPGYPWDLLRTYREDVRYITVSRARQRELSGLYGCDPSKIGVIYAGVDPADLYSLSEQGEALVERLDLAAADLVLLMPVRITQAKNIELALRVTARLKGKGIIPRLVVTGPPDPHDPENMQVYQRLLNLRHQLGVESEARFVYESGPEAGVGYMIDQPLLRQLYRACDVLFIPSHREGFGMPILEAGFVGMPVFSTAIPAAVEIGAGEIMHISPDESVEAIATRIFDWAERSPTQVLRRRMRKDFTWEAIFKRDILPLLLHREAS